MRLLTYFVSLLVFLVLSACGGGGGSPGIPSKTPNPITAPTELTLKVSGTSDFVIAGGSAPFQLKIGNEQVASVSWSSANVRVYGKTSGETELLITDASLQTATVKVKVENLAKFYTTAPAALTMTPGSEFRDYLIGGGQPPYFVSSVPKEVVSVVGSSGTLLRVTPGRAGSATVTVSDSATPERASTTISVEVKSLVKLAVSPVSAATYVDLPVEVSVTGGTPPYRWGGVTPSLFSITPSTGQTDPSKFSVTPLKAAVDLKDSVITFIDSQNAQVDFTLTTSTGTPGIRVSPNVVSVSALDDQNIILNVFGATLPITAFSSDVAAMLATVADGVVTVSTGTAGSRCVVANGDSVTITVVDSTGASGTSKITINDVSSSCIMAVAPSSVTLSSTATTATSTILRGAGPFVASSSDAAVATAEVSGSTVTMTRVGTVAGTATITVIDKAGKVVTISVTNIANP